MSVLSDSIIDMGKDSMVELFSDVVKANGLEGIPVVSMFVNGLKTIDSVRDIIFYRKIIAFFCEVQGKDNVDKRLELLRDLDDNPFKDKVGNVIINYIDRCDGVEKARLHGMAFEAYLKIKYNKDTWIKICHGIDALPTISVRDFYDAFKIGGGENPEPFNFMPIAASGLADNGPRISATTVHKVLCFRAHAIVPACVFWL